MSLTCPKCQQTLVQQSMPHGIFWRCENCGGHALGLDLLRRTFRREQINAVWQRVMKKKGAPGATCPACRNRMIEITATDEEAPRIEACRLCHFLWFDAEELKAFAPVDLPKPEAQIPLGERQAKAIAQVKAMAMESESAEPTAEFWKQLGNILRLGI